MFQRVQQIVRFIIGLFTRPRNITIFFNYLGSIFARRWCYCLCLWLFVARFNPTSFYACTHKSTLNCWDGDSFSSYFFSFFFPFWGGTINIHTKILNVCYSLVCRILWYRIPSFGVGERTKYWMKRILRSFQLQFLRISEGLLFWHNRGRLLATATMFHVMLFIFMFLIER